MIQSLLSCEQALSVYHHESCWVGTQLYEASKKREKEYNAVVNLNSCLLLATSNSYTVYADLLHSKPLCVTRMECTHMSKKTHSDD